jgi:hypothetical protein
MKGHSGSDVGATAAALFRKVFAAAATRSGALVI